MTGMTLRAGNECKVLHFIRHAQGFHNLRREDLEDAHLTPEGWDQVADLRRQYAEDPLFTGTQVVIASPLVRALQTACGIFGAQHGDLLMRSTSSAADSLSKHDPLFKGHDTPIILASELCKERIDPKPCNRRQLLSKTMFQFPGVDFSGVETETDAAWYRLHQRQNKAGRALVGESESEIVERAEQLLRYLYGRPETIIAVVSHSEFLFYLCTQIAGVKGLTGPKDLLNASRLTMFLSKE